jgi:formylmethanofuran dehydrogenase subunit E-like metal-binding protein
MAVIFSLFSFTMICTLWAADELAWGKPAREALGRAMSEIGVAKADPDLLVLTNAGYGTVGNHSTEVFLDTVWEETGCSLGKRSLLPVHSGIQEQLWCSLYRKDTGKLIFIKWTGKAFEQQIIDACPARILTPDGWQEAAGGIIGPRIFSVVSISLTWAVEPPWPLLQAALFHDHFCPGVNSGFIAGEYLMDTLPLRPGEKYVFVAAPGKCAADALQMMLNATAGKSSGYAMAITSKALAKYARGEIQPSIVAMRVNRQSDTCDGRILGFDWNKAYTETGVKAKEIAPQGGTADPMFWIARTKMSRELAHFPKAKLTPYIVELKSFSGKASLADRFAGGDPYAAVWKQ